MASFAARASTMVESHAPQIVRTAATQAIVVAAALEALIPATQEQLRGLHAGAHRIARQASAIQKEMMATPARRGSDAPPDLRA